MWGEVLWPQGQKGTRQKISGPSHPLTKGSMPPPPPHHARTLLWFSDRPDSCAAMWICPWCHCYRYFAAFEVELEKTVVQAWWHLWARTPAPHGRHPLPLQGNVTPLTCHPHRCHPTHWHVIPPAPVVHGGSEVPWPLGPNLQFVFFLLRMLSEPDRPWFGLNTSPSKYEPCKDQSKKSFRRSTHSLPTAAAMRVVCGGGHRSIYRFYISGVAQPGVISVTQRRVMSRDVGARVFLLLDLDLICIIFKQSRAKIHSPPWLQSNKFITSVTQTCSLPLVKTLTLNPHRFYIFDLNRRKYTVFRSHRVD